MVGEIVIGRYKKIKEAQAEYNHIMSRIANEACKIISTLSDGETMIEYKVNIPSMIRRQDSWIASALSISGIDSNDYRTIKKDFVGKSAEGSYCFSDIPGEWLEEVKQSAFQKWYKENEKHLPVGKEYDAKIWNAAIDHIISLDCIDSWGEEMLKELKEP